MTDQKWHKDHQETTDTISVTVDPEQGNSTFVVNDNGIITAYPVKKGKIQFDKGKIIES